MRTVNPLTNYIYLSELECPALMLKSSLHGLLYLKIQPEQAPEENISYTLSPIHT